MDTGVFNQKAAHLISRSPFGILEGCAKVPISPGKRTVRVDLEHRLGFFFSNFKLKHMYV